MQVAQDKLDDLVHRIVEVAHPIRIVLFGSAARGNTDTNSDIDIMVVVPDGIHRRKTAQEIEVALAGFGLPVDLVVANPTILKMYSSVPGYVYREVLRDGVDLYAA